MSLLAVPIVKSSHTSSRIYFIFLKDVIKKTWKWFNIKLWPELKDEKSKYQLWQALAMFCNVIAIFLSQNWAKSLRVNKNVKEIKLEGVGCNLEAKKCFQRIPFTKYLRLTLVFILNFVLWEKFNFCFAQFFGSINKILILVVRNSARLVFHEV